MLEAPLWSLLITGRFIGTGAQAFLSHLCAAVVMFYAAPKEWGWLNSRRHWGEPMAFWTLLFPAAGWLFMGFAWLSLDSIEKKKEKENRYLIPVTL